MAIFTTQVKSIVDFYSQDIMGIDEKINTAAPFIFNFNFPIWDQSYTSTLEYKILLHYYMKEIAFETVGLWKLYLKQTMTEIMPYYCKLWETVAREYDYMNDTYINERIQRDKTELGKYNDKSESQGNSSNTTSSESNTDGKTLGSDLPQTTESQMLGSDYYANNIVKTNSGSKDSSYNQGVVNNAGNNSGNNSRQVGEIITTAKWGNQGGKSQTELLMQYRKSLINIDMMIIDELKELFMPLYSTGEVF